MDVSHLLREIMEASSSQGINQKELAQRARIPEETLSRLKKGGNPTLATLDRLAQAVGLQVCLAPKAPENAFQPAFTTPSEIPSTPATFRTKHPTLVWSNSNVDDATLIKKALLKPRFPVLLDAALAFGLARIESEWAALLAEPSPEVKRAYPVTQRLLRNIQHGYEQATA